MMTITIESKKIIEKMEGHTHEYAYEIAYLSNALDKELASKESLEDNFL
jgi:hypothetical protein